MKIADFFKNTLGNIFSVNHTHRHRSATPLRSGTPRPPKSTQSLQSIATTKLCLKDSSPIHHFTKSPNKRINDTKSAKKTVTLIPTLGPSAGEKGPVRPVESSTWLPIHFKDILHFFSIYFTPAHHPTTQSSMNGILRSLDPIFHFNILTFFISPAVLSYPKSPFYQILLLPLLLLSTTTQASIKYTGNQYQHTLEGTWQFTTDLYNQGTDLGWHLPDYQPVGWDSLEVPGNWDLENEYADYVGKGWYRRTFEAPADWQQKNVRIIFEAVYNDAQVWINGIKIGEHHVGFLPFWFDINEVLNFGGENTIVVVADNTFKRGALWNWGGIRRPVWLEVTPKTRLEYQHITPRPDLEKGTADIVVAFEINNSNDEPVEAGYQLSIFYDNELVHRSPSRNRDSMLDMPAASSKKHTYQFTLPKSKTHLWHFNHPHLYRAELTLYENGQVIHQLNDQFGIRKVEVAGENFKLNGEVVRTVGFNLVPDDRTNGSTLPLWRIKQDVDMMKELGANMARVAHTPLPEAFLDYLDQKGIMTFEEVSLWGKDEMVDPEHPLPKYWLEKMVYVKYNHPSIIGWSIGNEIGYIAANPKVMEYVKGATEHARTLDPTRLAVYVTHSAQRQEIDPVQYSDLIMYNAYGGWGENVARINEYHPGKPIFMSEYGNHLNDINPNQAEIPAKMMLDQFRGKPYMTGASLWTFNDYRSFWQSRPTWTTPPSQNRTWGVVNVYRQKKRAYFDYKREHSPVVDFRVTPEERKAVINFSLRGKYDLPAYPMEGYRIVWQVFDQEQQVLQGGIAALPRMEPGDPELSETIEWSQNSTVFGLKVDILDPQAYSVRDTTIYFQPPATPEILKIHTATNVARVVFEPVIGADSYKLIYGKSDLDQETPPTINDFLEISELDNLESYQLAVVAVNNAGESKPTPVQKAQLDEDELPPVIWKTIPYHDKFFIGYTVDNTDYIFEVEYGTSPGNYDHHLGLRNVGVVQVPGLKSGETYYYRFRRRKQWGFASEWTHEIKVNLPEPMDSCPVKIHGSFQTGTTAMIAFEPVEKAVGYTIRYRENGASEWQQQELNAAVLEYAVVEDLKKNREYEFAMEAKL